MAQIRGQHSDTRWHPISVEKVGSEYIVKVANVSGIPKHYNGVANIAPATVTFAKVTKSIIIKNLNAGVDIDVSFDGGSNTFMVDRGSSLSLEANITSVDISASVDGTAYQILTVE